MLRVWRAGHTTSLGASESSASGRASTHNDW